MKKICFAFIAVLALVVSCKGRKAAAEPEWEASIPTDSIYCRDPFIVADPQTKTYYLFRSSTTAEGLGGVEVFKSKDLAVWSEPERVFKVPEDNFITGSVCLCLISKKFAELCILFTVLNKHTSDEY